MLTWLFLRKANSNRIKQILNKEGFIYTMEDVESLLKGNQKGVRYGNIVLSRKEIGAEEKRFLKLVLDGTWRTFKLFRRQVEVTRALANDDKYAFRKLSVKSFSLKGPVPYAIFETREEGNDFGFMHDKPEYYEKFSEEDVLNLVKVIYGFHLFGKNVGRGILKHTQKISSKARDYRREVEKNLTKVITHKFSDGSVKKEKVENLLEEYTLVSNIGERVMEVFEKNWKSVNPSKDNIYLVHADMALDNVYKHKDGAFEPLDFEWVGYADNPVVPIMYDYGNLRARAWSSPSFQLMLDKSMLEEGVRQYGDENMVKAALHLGVLRSGIMMCRYHMDINNTVKKDRRTEKDYFEMFPKTVSSIANLLKSEN